MHDLKANLALCVEHVRRSGRDGIDTRSLSRKLSGVGIYRTGMLCRALAAHGLMRDYARKWVGVAPHADDDARVIAAAADVRRIERAERSRIRLRV